MFLSFKSITIFSYIAFRETELIIEKMVHVSRIRIRYPSLFYFQHIVHRKWTNEQRNNFLKALWLVANITIRFWYGKKLDCFLLFLIRSWYAYYKHSYQRYVLDRYMLYERNGYAKKKRKSKQVITIASILSPRWIELEIASSRIDIKFSFFRLDESSTKA